MKKASLKFDNPIFTDIEKILLRIKILWNRYINETIENYNRFQKRLLLEKKLKNESEFVKKDSMEILKEFEICNCFDH